MRDIEEEGLKKIIWNRKDGEGGEEKKDFEEIERVEEKEGIED